MLVLPRADLSAAPTEVTLASEGVNPAMSLAVIGDWLVSRSTGSAAVKAQPRAVLTIQRRSGTTLVIDDE